MTYREMQMEGTVILLRAGCPEPQADARELLFFVTGLNLSSYAANMNETVPEDAAERFFSCIERRKMREPVQYITGCAGFFGYEFLVTPAVLIPRYDTEISVEEALRYVRTNSAVLDLCTGSGCIILSMLKEAQKKFGKEFSVHGDASDVSKEALEVAKSNSEKFRIDVNFILSDLFNNIDGFYDIIISNPPYIPNADIYGLDPEVADYEPRLALDGKTDGLYFYRKIVDEARRHLKCGGRLIMEIGYDQAESVMSLLLGAGYTDIRCLRDLAGRDRSVSAGWDADVV